MVSVTQDTLQVFVSSSMEELAEERRAVRESLAALRVHAWLFEADAGARPDTPRQTFVGELEQADLYLGLFWTKLGDYTLEEYELARELDKPCLIYTKEAAPERPRDPALDAFIARIESVDTGRTVSRFRDARELREMIAADVTRWQTRRVREQDGGRAAADPLQHALATLQAKVETWYVRDFLQGVVARMPPLPVRVEPADDALDGRHGPKATTPAVAGASSDDEFVGSYWKQPAQSLLILGEAGCGKTVLMVKVLAGALRRRAMKGLTPVVLNLSSWKGGTALAAWLQAEIGSQYRVGQAPAARWLQEGRLALFLDGLDEVSAAHRRGCVEAINRYVREQFVPRIVMCCRSHVYEEIGERLALETAVRIRPLVASDLDNFAAQSDERLRTIGALLHADPNLRDVATSPLLLTLMGGVPLETLRGALVRPSSDEARQIGDRIVRLYVDQVSQQRSTQDDPQPATAARALAWVARRATIEGGGHVELDGIQPEWLSRGVDRWLYVAATRFIMLAISGAAYGLLLALAFAPTIELGTVVSLMSPAYLVCGPTILVDGLRLTARPGQLWMRVLLGGVAMRIGAVACASTAIAVVGDLWLRGWQIADVFGELLSLEGILFVLLPVVLLAIVPQVKVPEMRREIRPRGDVELSRARAIRTFASLFVLHLGITALLGAELFTDLDVAGGQIAGLRSPLSSLLSWWLSGVGTWMLFSLPVGIVASLAAAEISIATYPGQGIVNAARAAAVVFALGGVLTAVMGYAVLGLQPRNAMVAGVAFGLAAAFVFSAYDVMAHWLLRAFLSAECGVPLGRFLKWGARSGVLRRVGGRYVFRHALVADSAAELAATPEAERAAQRRVWTVRLAAITLVALAMAPGVVALLAMLGALDRLL